MTSNIISCVVVLLLFSGLSIVAKAQSKTAKTMIVKTSIYCVHCLECNDCGGKLVHDLLFEKGVKSNSVDPIEMTIKITYNPTKTSPEKLRAAIAKLAYDADE